MLKRVASVLVAVFAVVAVSAPADAARRKKSSARTVTYSSQIVAGPTRAVTYRAASSRATAPQMAAIYGIRDRSVSAFAHSVDGHAFFEDQASRGGF